MPEDIQKPDEPPKPVSEPASPAPSTPAEWKARYDDLDRIFEEAGVNKTDPAYLAVMTALNWSVRANEEIPAAILNSAKKLLGAIELAKREAVAAVEQSAKTAVDRKSVGVDQIKTEINEAAKAAAAQAASDAARKGYESAKKSYNNHLDNNYLFGKIIGVGLTLLGVGVSFTVGRLYQSGGLNTPTNGLFATIWNTPLGWPVLATFAIGLLGYAIESAVRK